MHVCLFVCPLAYFSVHVTCGLDRSSFERNAIFYVLPVLCMMSCFHIMVGIAPIEYYLLTGVTASSRVFEGILFIPNTFLCQTVCYELCTMYTINFFILLFFYIRDLIRSTVSSNIRSCSWMLY